MSPVAIIHQMEREAQAERKQWQEALMRLAQQNHTLKQEVTGGLQIIGYLASQCPDNTLFIKGDDLITIMGSVQRKHDKEHGVYAFTYLPPSAEELAEYQKAIEAAAEAPALSITEEVPGDEVPPVAIGEG
jgi:hypothetical protein